jgi:hypothetical protein
MPADNPPVVAEVAEPAPSAVNAGSVSAYLSSSQDSIAQSDGSQDAWGDSLEINHSQSLAKQKYTPQQITEIVNPSLSFEDFAKSVSSTKDADEPAPAAKRPSVSLVDFLSAQGTSLAEDESKKGGT